VKGPYRNIAIIGGGFSGTLMALNLLRFDGPKATLIERNSAQLGRGCAYSTADSWHLLNVRAANMSAFPDQPHHFTDWLTSTEGRVASSFIPRADYGRYLLDLLESALAKDASRLSVLEAEACDIDVAEDEVSIWLSDGQRMSFDAVILAQGNLPPHPLPVFEPLEGSKRLFWPDPWAPGLTDDLSPDATVLLMGTGLTAIDIALKFDASGFRGKIVALSRRGLRPKAHDTNQPALPPRVMPQRRQGSTLVKFVRKRSQEIGWRGAIDELRPDTQTLWQNETAEAKARFLRHLRPYWDIHRHRLAPQVAGRVDDLIDQGRLAFIAGKPQGVVTRDGRLEIVWRPRGTDELGHLPVDRIVNCSGPNGDVRRSEDPLIRNLVAKGLMRPDEARLGIDVDSQSFVLRADGRANKTLLAVGPMTRGAFWEIVAVPDIRQQTWTLARRLSHAHWVGGEGL
jgi:uncharacterized NAD(P)/FAD-binding protein YdhS